VYKDIHRRMKLLATQKYTTISKLADKMLEALLNEEEPPTP
jgi:hypothetical protein